MKNVMFWSLCLLVLGCEPGALTGTPVYDPNEGGDATAQRADGSAWDPERDGGEVSEDGDVSHEDAELNEDAASPDPEVDAGQVARCGDGTCGDHETCASCSEDCGECPPLCGDGVCEGGETCDSCPRDCDACGPVCGDGVCDGGEVCGDCPQDCGACPPVCGDNLCEGAETCGECAQDCGACGWPEDLARSEEALLVMVNDQRAIGANCGGVEMPPAGPLRMNAELRQAARLHSQDMADNNYFDHTGLDGSTFSVRASRAGYQGFAGGENIAAGNAAADATFQQWLHSPGHCQNMMRGRFSEIGVGHASGGGQYRDYWCQVFGG